MSGDNLYGSQPLKFYSEHITLTKLILIDYHLKIKNNKCLDICDEEEFLNLKNLLSR
tara:strand:+ start:221 stop:391 length:171 start_codon:yes stop_codon:yes gene_type:complete